MRLPKVSRLANQRTGKFKITMDLRLNAKEYREYTIRKYNCQDEYRLHMLYPGFFDLWYRAPKLNQIT